VTNLILPLPGLRQREKSSFQTLFQSGGRLQRFGIFGANMLSCWVKVGAATNGSTVSANLHLQKMVLRAIQMQMMETPLPKSMHGL